MKAVFPVCQTKDEASLHFFPSCKEQLLLPQTLWISMNKYRRYKIWYFFKFPYILIIKGKDNLPNFKYRRNKEKMKLNYKIKLIADQTWNWGTKCMFPYLISKTISKAF